MKFDTKHEYDLYGEMPDEESGSSAEAGWYGLYRDELTILTESTEGFVKAYTFPNLELLEAEWESILNQEGEE